jgi:N-acetylglucosaminyldiphosphoundecaprenol N-acetyl-beta-D-mannosaminyltransferase
MQRILAEEDRSIEHIRERLRQLSIFILGVRAENIDSRMALSILYAFATRGGAGAPACVLFTNVHSIHLARRDRELMYLVNGADLVLPDGSGLKIAGRLFGTPILENLNGTDLIPRFLARAESEGLKVYLLGGKPRVIEDCVHRLLAKHPDLRIAGFHHGHFLPEEEESIVEEINARGPHILLVALGTPLQERWIARNSAYLKVGVCIGVGGLFNFLSGTEARAPFWMRRLGIEWLYRFMQDPRAKWSRVFIEIPTFLALIFVRRIAPKRV